MADRKDSDVIAIPKWAAWVACLILGGLFTGATGWAGYMTVSHAEVQADVSALKSEKETTRAWLQRIEAKIDRLVERDRP